MSPSFTTFGAGFFKPVEPVKLSRTADLLERKYGRGPGPGDDAARAAALTWLRQARAGAAAPCTRSVARGLASLYVRPPDRSVPALRDEILGRIAEHVRVFAFRDLWSLWQLGEPTLGVVAGALESLLAAPRSARIRRRLPEWAHEESFDFEDPLSGIVGWIERKQLVLVELTHVSLRLSLGSGLGASVLIGSIRQGSAAWWARQDANAVRAWAAKRSMDVRAAVAERQLIEVGQGASSVADMPRTDEASRLKTWALQELGDPARHPGPWRDVAPRAVEVFEWMLLWDQLVLIFDEFAKNAEDDRAEFWRELLPLVRDARYYQAHDTAVCILAFEGLMVIEFGTTGNATYVYSRPEANIRRLGLRAGLGAAHFKRTTGMDIPGMQCDFLTRMSHVGSWQWGFRRRLEELGLDRPAKKKRSAPPPLGDRRDATSRAQNTGTDPEPGLSLGAHLAPQYQRAILEALRRGESIDIDELRLQVEFAHPALPRHRPAFEAALVELERQYAILRLGRNTVHRFK